MLLEGRGRRHSRGEAGERFLCEQAAGRDWSTGPSDPWTCTVALWPSPPCHLGTGIRCPLLSAGGSCGLFSGRLNWGEWAELEGGVASEVKTKPLSQGEGCSQICIFQDTLLSCSFSLLLLPRSSLLPQASFSPFQKISGVLSEARVAGACSLWGLSVSHTCPHAQRDLHTVVFLEGEWGSGPGLS